MRPYDLASQIADAVVTRHPGTWEEPDEADELDPAPAADEAPQTSHEEEIRDRLSATPGHGSVDSGPMDYVAIARAALGR